MNDTKSYILELRDTLSGRLAARFLFFLFLSVLSCGIAFAVTSQASYGGYFLAVCPVEKGSFAAAFLSVLRCASSSAAALLLIYAAAHTVFSQAVSGAVLLWRGISLGCTGGLISGGMVESVGRHWIPALTLYFAATVLMILLAAVSHVYSLGICRAHSDGVSRIRRELAVEYLQLFLILSGGVFVLGCTAVLLI